MSEDTQNRASKVPPNGAKRDLLLGLGGLVLFILIGLGAIAFSDPGGTGLLFLTRGPKADAPIDLTVLHTNDTWGYLSTCGG